MFEIDQPKADIVEEKKFDDDEFEDFVAPQQVEPTLELELDKQPS